MKVNKTLDVILLGSQLTAAGVTHRGLGTTGSIATDDYDLHTYNAAGEIIDIPASAAPVIAAHVPSVKKYDDQIVVREIQTTNATPQVVNLPLISGTLYISEIIVVGVQDVSPFNSATFTKRASVGRAGGGAVLVGQEDLHTPFKSAGASGWNAVLSVNGNNAVITLTGGATTINWTIKSTYFRINKDGLVG